MNSPHSKTPNNHLCHERELRGWSQEDLAEKVGTTQKVVSRWERGESTPLPYYRQKLCTLFGKNAVELGFLDERSSADHPREESAQNNTFVNENNDMNRRQVLQGLGALGGSLVTHSQELLNPDALERMVRILKRPSRVDNTMLMHLEAMTRAHWQLYAGFENAIQYRRDLLGGVAGHLHTITQLMNHTQSTHTYDRLANLASETAQLIGEIFFDLKDSHSAERYYNVALRIVHETKNEVSQAIALGRKSFLSIYADEPQRALAYIHEAHTQLQHEPSDIVIAWLSAREAEACANIRDENACFHALERAELHLGRARPEETSYAFADGAVDVHITRSILSGFKGVCYLRLKHPQEALAVFQQDLATTDTTRSIHNAIVRIDLAMTNLQLGELEEACHHAGEAIDIMLQLQSARVYQRLLHLKRQLEPWRNTKSVRDVDEQVSAIPYVSWEERAIHE